MERKRVWRLLLKAALLFASVEILCGCGQDRVIRVGIIAESNWDVPNGTVYELVDLAAERFEEEHPGVQVEYVSGILREDYSEWLAEQLLLGTEPDVFMVLSEDFNMLASVGALRDLTSFVERDSSVEPADWYPAAYESGQWQEKQLALTYECVPRLMFVNRTLLKREGIDMPENDWTWEDFYEICRQVTKDRDGNGVLDQFGCYGYTWTDAAYANGNRLFDGAGTECYVSDPAVEEAVRFVERLNELNVGAVVTAQDFDLGRVAFQPLLFSEYRAYSPYPWRIKKYTGFEWECLSMPSGPSGGNISELDVLLMGISARCENPELAWDFLKLMTCEPSVQEQIFSLSQGASGLRQVVTSPAAMERLNEDMPRGSSIDLELISGIMETAVAKPTFRRYAGAMDMLEEGVAEALGDERNVHTALIVLQRKVKSFLTN